MKHLFIILIVLTSSNVVAQEQTSKPLRHAFQTTAPSKVPYGNNSKAGRYANAGDAKSQLGIVPNGPHSVIQTHLDTVREMVKPFVRRN